MKLTLECPFAEYDETMRIQCKKAGSLCANQRWKPCKGWYALTEWAKDCPARSEQEVKTNGRRTTGKKRKN